MSLRIAYGALAASIVLVGVLANAARDCFESSCRLLGVVEALPVVALPPAEPVLGAKAGLDTGVASRAEAAPAQAEPTAFAQMVVERSSAQPAVDVGAPQLATSSRRNLDAAPEPIAATGDLPTIFRQPSAVRTATYAPRRNSARSVGVFARAPVIQLGPGVAPTDAIAIVRPDPAWMVCQTDYDDRDGHDDYCGPYSYRPYGAHGYRRYGTYRAYRSEPAYLLAPDAKIISIDRGD